MNTTTAATTDTTRVYKGDELTFGTLPKKGGLAIQTMVDMAVGYGIVLPTGSIVLLLSNLREGQTYFPRIRRLFNGKLGVDELLNRKMAPGATYSYSCQGVTPSTPVRVLSGTRGKELMREYLGGILSGVISHSTGVVTIGGDPEVFVLGGDGQVLPAWKFLPSKEEATQGGKGGYWDGFQAEFTTAKHTCCNRYTESVNWSLQKVLSEALKVDKKARLVTTSTMEIPTEVLQEIDPKHAALGCSPSLNAYGTEGEKIRYPRLYPFRNAGYHFHFGNEEMRKDPVPFVKAFDRVVGIATVGMFAEMDNPARRRSYGLAGEYRSTAYGLEYRTLSASVLCHPAIGFWCWDNLRLTMHCIMDGLESLLPQINDEDVQSIINTCDVKGAREVAKQNEALYRMFSRSYYGQSYTAPPEMTMKLIMEGVGSVLGTDSIEKYWNLRRITEMDSAQYFSSYNGQFDVLSKGWYAKNVGGSQTNANGTKTAVASV